MKPIALVLAVLSFIVAGCGSQPNNVRGLAEASGIVNGREVSAKSEIAQSTVALLMRLDQGEASCTGTIISPNVVLTAAHCVEGHPQKIVVVFNTDLHQATRQDVRLVTDYLQNPLWGQHDPHSRGDLALVKFTGSLPDGYQPVTLVDPDFQIKKNEKIILAGYGVTDGLTHAGVGVLRQTETTALGMISPTEMETDGQNHSVCFGDSGGPAFIRKGGELLQIGVASAVLDQSCDKASVHTLIPAFENWIQSTVRQLQNR